MATTVIVTYVSARLAFAGGAGAFTIWVTSSIFEASSITQADRQIGVINMIVDCSIIHLDSRLEGPHPIMIAAFGLGSSVLGMFGAFSEDFLSLTGEWTVLNGAFSEDIESVTGKWTRIDFGHLVKTSYQWPGNEQVLIWGI